MNRFPPLFLGLMVLLGGVTPSTAVEPSVSHTEGVTQINFPTTGSPPAQEKFLRGVFLLHSFEYDDAQEAFREAQKLDPDFAMAYWGEAMTETHPLWEEQDREQARAVLKRLAPTREGRVAKARSDREKGYLAAVEALYGQGDKISRDHAYADAMRHLVEEYPDDQEAKAFYALALLGTAQDERDFAIAMKAAALAEDVFQHNPRHPGAVHYLIHAYDDPIHAPLGLRPARVFPSIAPTAPHAQHMPSHIFMALGLWDEVVKANEVAWKGSEDRRRHKGLGLEERPYHVLHWLLYAYLQQSRFGKAKTLLELVEEDAGHPHSGSANWYLASMRATYIIETKEWNVDFFGRDRSGLRFSAAARELFAVGLSAVKTSRVVLARNALAQLRNRLESARTQSSSSQLLGAEVMEKELEALILLAEGQSSEAVAFLEKATVLEESRSFVSGPPYPIKPSPELFGEVLLSLGKPREAEDEFRQALARTPKRFWSVKGLAQAGDQLGKGEG